MKKEKPRKIAVRIQELQLETFITGCSGKGLFEINLK
jgi:hypothetical protein